MKDRKLGLKTVFLLLVSVSALLVSVCYYTWANNSSTFTISQGVYPGAPSYTIWKEDSTYYAKNSFGVLTYYGTNASNVVNNAIDALPSTEGGLLHFTSQIFYFTHSIVIERTNVHLEGEGSDNTKLYLNDNSNCHLISITPSTLKNFISIRHMTLWGNKDSQSGQSHGIYIYGYTGDIFLTDLYIDDFLNKGIYVLPITRVHNLWIQRNLIEGCNEAGISLNNTVGIHFAHIKDNYIYNNQVGIRVYQKNGRGLEIEGNIIYENGQHGVLFEGVRYATLNDNQIFDNSKDSAYTYDGVYLGKTGSDQTYYITINDNFITNQGFTNYQRYGINIADLSDNLEIQDNYLSGNSNGSINIASGAATSSEIHGNLGFRTEYFGYATISASTEVYVAHNLVGTPVSVTLTPDNHPSGWNGIYWISNVNASHFKININQTQTLGFYWDGYYRPT